MDYNESLTFIHSLEKFGIKPGLERIAALCAALDNPQDKLNYIHVAGTNGKGSTSTMLSEIMQKAGYKTGLFTSPYVIDFCERIQINGNMITQSELAKIVSVLKPIITNLAEKGIQLTEFEAVTAAAFLYFAQEECDVVVLEVGLGGRFDSTNIIKTPLASVITSISLDHMTVLGDTVDKIAMEKCGIIKPSGITVSYPGQTADAISVIKRVAAAMKNELFVPKLNDIMIIDASLYGTNAMIDGLKIFIPFMGEHMVLNASVAVETFHVLAGSGFTVSDENIADGIAAARMPARMEIFGESPLMILDGGHNEGCAKALAECIKKYLNGKKIIAVCGMMADKDYNAYLKIAAPFFSTFIATKPAISRALDAQKLAISAGKYCANSFAIENSADALAKAKESASKDDVIIVCGSFYLAGELRKQMMTY